MSQKSLQIFYKDKLCGLLTRHESGEFSFRYDADYLNSGEPGISLSLPLSDQTYESERFFPFFDGLIPEGWLLNFSAQYFKLDAFRDRFELFEKLCFDCIGAVHVEKAEDFEKNRPISAFEEGGRNFSSKRCLICYELLDSSSSSAFHLSCSESFYGGEIAPCLNYHPDRLERLLKQELNNHLSIPGVQKKISLDTRPSGKGKDKRFTFVGLGGRYIFKPHASSPHLPANEDLCLKLASLAGIEVADSSLIFQEDGELGIISKRFDRGSAGERFHQEDFSQIFEKYTYEKYTGSNEKIGKVLNYYSDSPGDDIFRFVELVVFNFIIGNADAHLKNFSFAYERPNRKGRGLAPAYDLLSTDLYLDDPENSALTVNGKKSKLSMGDFLSFAKSVGIKEKVYSRLIEKFQSLLPVWQRKIEQSFLPDQDKERFKQLIENRLVLLREK